MNTFKTLLQRIVDLLSTNSIPFCLVGGFAVTFRAEPRLTRDIDIAVIADSDAQREKLILLLTNVGFLTEILLENQNRKTISTARLIAPEGKLKIYVDLIFDACGIEKEIVQSATKETVFDDLPPLPVATIASLIAMKCLSYSPENRSKDFEDLKGLLKNINTVELDQAKELLSLIQERNYSRGENLLDKLNLILSRL